MCVMKTTKGGETMTRVPDTERDVYGLFAVTVVNAYRHARRSNHVMSDDEWAIIQSVYDHLLSLDPAAADVRKAKIVVTDPYVPQHERTL